MFRMLPVLLTMAALSLLAGCVTSQSIALGSTTYPPRPKDHVIDVYVGTDAPVNVLKSIVNPKPISSVPSGAKEIGRVDTQGVPAATWGSVIADAKIRARSLGGDGIVIGQWGNPANIDAYGNVQYGKALSMSVIRYRP